MHILITNDDGVTHPGLLALAQALSKLGQVTVFAPVRNWSASGHVKTLHKPLRVWDTTLKDGTPALTTDGAPSDCVALALLGLIQDPIDIVVSGINPNANVGHDVTYSGTVTAAMEAAIFGLPGIATSIDSDREHGVDIAFDTAAEITSNLVHRFTDQHLPSGVFLNINIPNKLRAAINGVRITRQGARIYRDELVEREDPRGRKYYWIGGDAPTGVPEPGTDIGALSEGFVSITPLGLDLTAKDMVQNLETWNLQI